MKSKSIVTVLLVSIILASCAPAAKVIPTETAIPTSTFTPLSPTLTITPTLTATPDPNVIEVTGGLVIRLEPEKVNDLQKIAELTAASKIVTEEFDFQKLGINLDGKFEAEWVYKNGNVFAVKANGDPDNLEDVIAVWEQSQRAKDQWHVFWHWIDVIPYVMRTAKPGLWTEKGAWDNESILQFYTSAMQKIYPGIGFRQDFMFPFEPSKCSKLTKENNLRLYAYIYSDADNSRGSPQADWSDPDPRQTLAWLTVDDSVTVIRVNDFKMLWAYKECK